VLCGWISLHSSVLFVLQSCSRPFTGKGSLSFRSRVMFSSPSVPGLTQSLTLCPSRAPCVKLVPRSVPTDHSSPTILSIFIVLQRQMAHCEGQAHTRHRRERGSCSNRQHDTGVMRITTRSTARTELTTTTTMEAGELSLSTDERR